MKRVLILIVVFWVMLTLYNYYYMNFFFLAFEWLGLITILGFVSVVQIMKLVREMNDLSRLRIQMTLVFVSLFLLTYFRGFTNGIIEKIDWKLLRNNRREIVEKVKAGTLTPNVKYNGVICELPFEFPVVSNGGNDIWISKNEKDRTVTVSFWVFRNFFDSPSTQFVYTNDINTINSLEKRTKDKPDDNWRLEENWFRTYGDW